jgi:L-ascorbate peroxidase
MTSLSLIRSYPNPRLGSLNQSRSFDVVFLLPVTQQSHPQFFSHTYIIIIMVFLLGRQPVAMMVHTLLASTSTTTKNRDQMLSALKTAQSKVDELIQSKHCGPILVRLAWHDAGTYDQSLSQTTEWPRAGGAIASIRLEPEILHGANKGLSNALALLETIHEQVPDISYADLYQMASVRAIALAGGPDIQLKYGRVDVTESEYCSPEGNLPDGNPSPTTGTFGGPGGTASTQDTSAAGHLRKVFYRMGLDDIDIVALSGAHTFGRAYKDRSGEGQVETKYTNGKYAQPLADGTVTTAYTPGGSSWTPNFLVFDNSYFLVTKEHVTNAAVADPALLSMATDKAVFVDDTFRPFAERFRDSQDDFFQAYAAAHKKLSELGSKFDPPEGIMMS